MTVKIDAVMMNRRGTLEMERQVNTHVSSDYGVLPLSPRYPIMLVPSMAPQDSEIGIVNSQDKSCSVRTHKTASNSLPPYLRHHSIRRQASFLPTGNLYNQIMVLKKTVPLNFPPLTVS